MKFTTLSIIICALSIIRVSAQTWIDGNLGIGTKNPTERLAVEGTIKAKEINVTVNASDWPDYVFHKDYKIISLDSLSLQINKLGHLPGMPSAAEAKENGVNLGEMNRKLLEKVEELTLLLMEQNKKVETQGKEILELKKHVGTFNAKR